MYENRKQEFLDLFQKDIFPYLAQGEKERIKWIIKIIAFNIFLALFMYSIFLWVNSGEECPVPMVVGISMIIFVLGLSNIAGMNSYNKGFTTSIKSKYMNGIIGYFNGMKYIKPGENELQSIKNNPCFKNSEFFITQLDDCFVGNYKNTEYKITEVIDSPGKDNQQFIAPFRGVIFDFDTNLPENMMLYSKKTKMQKNLNFMTIVFSALFVYLVLFLVYVYKHNGFGEEFLGLIPTVILFLIFVISIIKSAKNSPDKMFKKANGIDVTNNYEFSSENPADVEKYIKPELINILENIKQYYKSTRISLNTYNDNGKIKLSVLISTTKDVFEICSLYKSMTKPKSMGNFFNQLSGIMDLIDYFADLESK